MGTEIKTWQIVDGKLDVIDTTPKKEGRVEPYDIEPWLESNPSIIGNDICIIGRQTSSKSGPIDLLGIDSSGNTVIVEIKRDRLPRECLAQAIDYASDVATWSIDRLSEICAEYAQKTLEEKFNKAFPDVDLETVNLNSTQRLVLIGFSIESSLERMIEWLSDTSSLNINAVVLSYVKTSSGDELLTKTTIISEELELERVRKQKKFEIPMSDEPGEHKDDELKRLLLNYLSKDGVTIQRIREILFPACLENKTFTRSQLKKEFVKYEPEVDESKVAFSITNMSSQLGMTKNDFLRQVISYDYPRHKWEKDNFAIRDQYRELVEQILKELNVNE